MQPHPSSAILIEGDGMAAVCVARLLLDGGVRVILQPNPRPKLATILLTPQTQQLLQTLFPSQPQHAPDIFEGFPRISRRIVQWGNAPVPLALPHSGIVASEEELLRRLWSRISPTESGVSAIPQDTVWTVQTSRNPADHSQSFGNLQAAFATVQLSSDALQESCWVESVLQGWLFLLATGEDRATLIAVGDTVEGLLTSSRLVAKQVLSILAHHAPVSSHPRLASRIADSEVIACGTAAMSFDPLCGEGAGNAVREAFLAAAVIRASLSGQDRTSLAEYYTGRLRKGFLRHLQTCLQFYSTGGSSSFWTHQSLALTEGVADLQRVVEEAPTSLFRLIDRDLIPV